MVTPLQPTKGLCAGAVDALLWLARGWALDASVFPGCIGLASAGAAKLSPDTGRYRVTKAGRRLAAQLRT